MAYLVERPVPGDRLLQALREGVAQRQVFPVLFASAKGGKGIEALLEGVVTLLPPAGGQEDGALSAVVYQVDHDPAMGKAAHLRVFSGTLENRDSIPLPQGDGTQKITQIRRSPLCGPGTCWGRRRPGPPASWQSPCCKCKPSPRSRTSYPP